MICVECSEEATGGALGWRAYLAEGEEEHVPLLVFYCPECALREFGPLPRRRCADDD